MTRDQYTELVAFLGRKFEEGRRHSTALFERASEELRVVAEGMDVRFEKVDGRLDVMDGRLDRMDQRLDVMEGRLDRMDQRFDAMDGRLDRMDQRFDSRLGSLEQTVTSLDEWVRRVVSDHETRIQALE